MILVFKDGTEWNVSAQSTKTCIIVVANDYIEVPDYADRFTEEELKGATLDGEILENIVPETIKTEQTVGGAIMIKLNSRQKTEIEILSEKVQDTDNAIMELAEIITGGME